MRCGLWRLVVVAAAGRRYAGQAMPYVEGIGNLPQFAIADTIDPGRDLFFHDIADRGSEALFESRLFEPSTRLSCLEELQQFRRSRQASDMGRQDTIDAALHLPAPPALLLATVFSR